MAAVLVILRIASVAFHIVRKSSLYSLYCASWLSVRFDGKSQTGISSNTTALTTGPSPGFRSKGDQKAQGGVTSFTYNIGCMQRPGSQT